MCRKRAAVISGLIELQRGQIISDPPWQKVRKADGIKKAAISDWKQLCLNILYCLLWALSSVGHCSLEFKAPGASSESFATTGSYVYTMLRMPPAWWGRWYLCLSFSKFSSFLDFQKHPRCSPQHPSPCCDRILLLSSDMGSLFKPWKQHPYKLQMAVVSCTTCFPTKITTMAFFFWAANMSRQPVGIFFKLSVSFLSRCDSFVRVKVK